MNTAETEPESSSWTRRALEIGFWVVAVGLFWTLDTTAKLDARQDTSVVLDDFSLITNQVTSALAVLVMVAFVASWLKQFPIDRHRPAQTLVGLALGSLFFALGHYVLSVVLRWIVFWANGMSYRPNQGHLADMLVLYRQDIVIFLVIVAIITTYRLVLAGGFERAEEATIEGPQLTGRETLVIGQTPTNLVVQTRGGERLLDISSIDYVEEAKKYVSIHADGKVYLVRSPLKSLLERLPVGKFVQTHRDFLVNIDRVSELQMLDSSMMLKLESGARVPVSRGYRDAVKAAVEP